MANNNDQLPSENIVLSLVRKTDRNDTSPHLEDLIDHRDGKTTSPDTDDVGDQDSLLDNHKSRNQADHLV